MAGTLARRGEGSLFRPGLGTGPMSTLRQEMDEQFENFFGTRELRSFSAATLPSIDVSETDDPVEIKTDVPGFKPDEIDIDVAKGGVTISGQHPEDKESDEGNGRKYHRAERRSGSVSRFVRLPAASKTIKSTPG